jgi:hypothetical protein
MNKLFIYIIFQLLLGVFHAQSVEYQFLSTSQKITKANKIAVDVTKSQTRYFWIVYGNYNKWVIIQDKPVGQSSERVFFEKFTISSISNLEGGYKRIWTWDANNNRVIFFLDDQSVDPYILRSNNDVNGDIVKMVYYYLD